MMCLDAAIREDIRKKLKVCMDFRAKIDITIVEKYTPTHAIRIHHGTTKRKKNISDIPVYVQKNTLD